MSAKTFYRLIVWLPLVLPGIVALITLGAGIRPTGPARIPAQLLLASLLGCIPYGVLALGATIWMEGRSEQQILRAAGLAPLLTSVAWIAFWSLAFFGNGGSLSTGDRSAFFFATALLGVGAVLVFGYAYVGFTVWLRTHAGHAGWIRSDAGDSRA